MQIQKPLYKITASLLNSWENIFNCDVDDEISARDFFIKTLKRERFYPSLELLRTVDFIKQCEQMNYAPISYIIKDGQFKVRVGKDYIIDDVNVRVLGYLDVLKQGSIYDIKRVTEYNLQDYFKDYKHHIYFALVPDATEFEYLIADGYNDDEITLYTEKYYRENAKNIEMIIKVFFSWLEDVNLFDTYKKYWQIDQKKKEN